MFSMIWIAVKVSAFLTAYGLIFAKLVRKPEAIWIRQRLLPLTVALFAGGLVLPGVWFYWIMICALIPAMSRSTSEAACLYVLTIIVTPGVSREMGIGGIYLLAFDKALFAGLGLGIAILMHRSRKRMPTGWFDLPFALAMVLELLGARGFNITSMLRWVLGVSVSMIFPYLVISRSLRRPDDLRRLLFTMAFGAFVMSCEAVYEWRIGFLPYELISQHLGTLSSISAYSKQRSGGLRAAAAFPESTSFGLFLAIAFLAMLASHHSFRNRRSHLLALMVVLMGLYAANARSPIIALTLGLLAYDFFRKRYGAMMGKMVLLGGAGAIAFSLAQVSPMVADRLGVSGGSVDSATYRDVLYTRGKEEIAKHPILGQSSSDAYEALADLRQGEGIVDFVNGYIYFGLIAGVGGIVILLFCFFGTATKMLLIRRRLQKVPELVPIGGLVFGVSLFTAVTAFTSGFGGRSSIIFYIVLAIASSLAVRRTPPKPVETIEPEPEPSAALVLVPQGQA